MVGVDGVGAQFGRQLRDGVGRVGVAHDQVAAQVLQLGGQLGDAGVDEFDPPVRARQAGQDRAVVDKNAIHGGAVAQGVVQGGVVEGAQVAPEPDQSGIE